MNTMISAITSNSSLQKVVISTGNILSNKLGRKSSEELLDGLKLTLGISECNETALTTTSTNHIELQEGKVLRATKELNEKLTENERPAISIGAKIFLNNRENGSASIEEAIKSLLQVLQVQHLDNVVLAYHPEPHENCNSSNSAPSTPNVSTSNDSGGNVFKWNSRTEAAVDELKKLWNTLEQFALDKKILQLGISDLDLETLSQLYTAARVPPTIAQINLSSCCVVPPALQEFCTEHDIQLLTHSDPEALLPINEQFIIPCYCLDWTIRYQVHVRCRGVLTAKGYLVGASKQEAAD